MLERRTSRVRYGNLKTLQAVESRSNTWYKENQQSCKPSRLVAPESAQSSLSANDYTKTRALGGQRLAIPRTLGKEERGG